MTSFSSFLPSKLLNINNRDRSSDPLSRLRFALETMPGSRKYEFTPMTRTEIITELYDAFWGSHTNLFVPNPSANLPLHTSLYELQHRLSFGGAGKERKPIPGRACGNIFKKGECCFRCRDCAWDDSCVLCSRCFHSTDHTGHNVSFFIAQQSGGCCDCGDAEAWRVPIGCPHHPPAESSSETPKVIARNITDISNPQSKSDQPVPPELQETMRKTVAYALDFILDTLDYSPDEPSIPANEADLRLQPSADPMMKDQFCVVLWNDEKHSFDDVIKLLVDTTNRTREEANDTAVRIDEQGREIVDMHANAIRLLETARTFSQIDLGVTVRRAYDTFREQISVVIIEWILDLTRSRLGTDTHIMREVIASQLLSPRKSSTLNPNSEAQKALSEVESPVRLDYMFLYHTRLWKRPRLNLKEVYASILSLSHDHKLAVASHFANVYHRIIDSYLLVDREAETSIKYFALQLFTVPSIALHIVRQHNIINRLLSIITSFFTNQIQGKRITYPTDPMAEIDVDAFPFKSKRFMPVFSDLRYLSHNEPVQELLAHNREFVQLFSKTCQLFMCINPNKRAVTSHVEYETDAWISVFNVTLSLSRVIKVYGDAFSRATPAELVAAISTVMHDILLVCTLTSDRLDREKFQPIQFHDVIFGEQTYSIVNFDVLDGWVSFHHSLQWLLAELFKHVDILTEENLRMVGLGSVRDVCLRNASEQAILTIIDFPLRVLSMIAQIRTGLWVRNGFAIRGQLLHYRDFMLRELCYDQDLFILQLALVILDSNLVFASVLDRFQLLHYFSGAIIHEAYEGPHLSSMVEELFYVLITVVSEEANATKMPLPAQVRREIVHALAMGACSYTDLTKRVAERMAEDVCFERVLSETANFKAPESTADFGMYELKDEAYDEVNPFYFHYARNRREEVENVLKARLKKKNPSRHSPNYDPVIVPKPWKCEEGPFKNLHTVFESDVLLQIIFYGLHNILVLTNSTGESPPSAEAILDQVLHLIMLGLVNHGATFSLLSSSRSFEQITLLDVICALEHHEKFKPYKARAEWIISQYCLHVPEEVQRRRKVEDAANGASDPEEVKRRAARARKEALMKQFKAQQASFAINFNDEDDEDEEMLDEMDAPVSYGTCIVCQEELNDSKVFGALGLLQPSKLIRKHPDGHNLYLNETLSSPFSLDRSPSNVDVSFPPKDAEVRDSSFRLSLNFQGFPNHHTRFGLHASVCTHMMHLECFQVYHSSIRQRQRAQATRNPPENIARKEFICPLCKSLGNVMLPVQLPSQTTLNEVSFPDWIRAAGISILKSRPDSLLDALHPRTGTGEFVFWSAQDSGYPALVRVPDRSDQNGDMVKLIEMVMQISKMFSQQTRHLRDRPEPDQGERGAGLYLPEELVGYTISALEIAQRGSGSPGTIVADNVPEAQMGMIRGLVAFLTKMVGLQFRGKLEEGRDAARQAIIKRLLPEWSRTSLMTSSFSHPLLLREPFTILVETAAVVPEILRHVLILTYYACLARTAIGIIFILTKTRSYQTVAMGGRTQENLFGDVRVFFMSVVRHSPVFEHAAELAFQAFGEARIEKLLYSFTLPFLRRAAILCRTVLPNSFLTVIPSEASNEYQNLLTTLGIPPLSDLPNQDTLQNALSGWCAHYGQSRAAAQMNCGVSLDFPAIYRTAKLPLVLDNLFADQEKALTCPRCNTAPLDAAICMICGTVCCMQSHCCVDRDNGDRGECNAHTRECGGSIGIYFLVKRCSLLYLYIDKGTFASSPYLDDHGEVDMSMRRGRRQYLHAARFEEMRKTWLSHGIPTLVARKLETTVDNGGWETL